MVRTIAVVLTIMVCAPTVDLRATDEPLVLSKEQEQFLKSLIPQVPEPKPTQEQQDQGFIIYWANPTANFYTNVAPTAEDLGRKPLIRTPAGEDEPLLLAVWGLRKFDYATVRVVNPFFETTVSGVPAQPGVYPQHRMATYYPGNLRGIPGHPVDKPQPKLLGKLGIPYFMHPTPDLTVEPGRNAFFWINVNVPKGTGSGKYEGQAELLLADNSAPQGETNRRYENLRRIIVPFTIEVLPIKLPRADVAYGAWFRGLVDGREKYPPQYLTDAMMMAYYRDMARHGHTSIGFYAGESIWDEQGHVTLEGRKCTKQVEMMIEAGLLHRDIPFLWLGAPHFGPQQSKRYAAEFRAEVEKRGWPDPVQYGHDEPGSAPWDQGLIKHFNQRHNFRAALRTATAISRKGVEIWGKHLDVWIVHNEFPKSPQLYEHFKTMAASHNAQLWEYDCVHRGTNPTWSRYHAGIYTWATGLEGNFIWCYGETFTWGSVMAQAWEPTFVRVQPSRFGPVSSVGWEARREGIEDYRYLRRIEALCKSGEGSKADEARRWLAELRARVLGTVIPQPPRYDAFCGWDERDLWSQCPQFQRGEFARIRDEAIQLLMDLEEVHSNAVRPDDRGDEAALRLTDHLMTIIESTDRRCDQNRIHLGNLGLTLVV